MCLTFSVKLFDLLSLIVPWDFTYKYKIMIDKKTKLYTLISLTITD